MDIRPRNGVGVGHSVLDTICYRYHSAVIIIRSVIIVCSLLSLRLWFGGGRVIGHGGIVVEVLVVGGRGGRDNPRGRDHNDVTEV